MALRTPSLLRAKGRGRRYGPIRGLLELTFRLCYQGSWPARTWEKFPWGTRVQRVEHTLPVLPPGVPRLRIGYASDLHIGPTTSPKLLARAAALLAEAKPDVLFLGGDYVFLDATAPKAAALTAFVEAVPAKWKFAVLGNHDLWTRHEVLEAALEAGGARVLVNDAFRLPAPYDQFAILGVDDPWTGAPDPEAALQACGDAPVKVCLVHSPRAARWVAGRVTALLCGHTHGGHIAWPNYSPVIAPGRSARKWPWGHHDVEGTQLVVSRGLGGVEIPFRTWAPPDVMVVDLVPRNA